MLFTLDGYNITLHFYWKLAKTICRYLESNPSPTRQNVNLYSIYHERSIENLHRIHKAETVGYCKVRQSGRTGPHRTAGHRFTTNSEAKLCANGPRLIWPKRCIFDVRVSLTNCLNNMPLTCSNILLRKPSPKVSTLMQISLYYVQV